MLHNGFALTLDFLGICESPSRYWIWLFGKYKFATQHKRGYLENKSKLFFVASNSHTAKPEQTHILQLKSASANRRASKWNDPTHLMIGNKWTISVNVSNVNKPSTPRENNQLNFICHHSIRVNEHTHNNQTYFERHVTKHNVEAKKINVLETLYVWQPC